MKKSIVFFCFFVFLPLTPLSLSFAEGLSPQEVVKRSDDLMRGDTQEGLFTMTIVTPAWRRTLKLYVASHGRDRIFIRILSPAKEAGLATLRVKNEMWNYLPQVERTVKIPPSMMLQPWMGSDFANDDLVKESSVVNDYNHAFIGEENIGGEDVYVIELEPKPGAGVVWEKRVMRIRKKDFIPVREEFYGKNDKLIKVLHCSQIKKISDRVIPARWEMASEIRKGHRTIIEVDASVVYNKSVDEGIFVLQNLKSR